MCCTGAHLLPKTGKENRLPTTATAHKTPALQSFWTFIFFIFDTPLNSDRETATAASLLPPNIILPFTGSTSHPLNRCSENTGRKRSRLAGLLSRRNTASHRCCYKTQGAPPLSAAVHPRSFALPPFKKCKKTGDTRCGVSEKSSFSLPTAALSASG